MAAGEADERGWAVATRYSFCASPVRSERAFGEDIAAVGGGARTPTREEMGREAAEVARALREGAVACLRSPCALPLDPRDIDEDDLENALSGNGARAARRHTVQAGGESERREAARDQLSERLQRELDEKQRQIRIAAELGQSLVSENESLARLMAAAQDALARENSALRGTVEQLQAALGEAEEGEKNMRRRLAELRESYEERARLQQREMDAEAEATSAQLAEAERRAAALRARVSELERAADERRALETQHAALLGQLEAATARARLAEQRAEEGEARLRAACGERDQAMRHVVQADAELAQSTRAVAALEAQLQGVQGLVEQNASLRGQLSEASLELSTLREEARAKRALEAELARVRAALSEAQRTRPPPRPLADAPSLAAQLRGAESDAAATAAVACEDDGAAGDEAKEMASFPPPPSLAPASPAAPALAQTVPVSASRRTVRAFDVQREFFCLTALSVKMRRAREGAAGAALNEPIDALFREARRSAVPFEDWHEWVSRRLAPPPPPPPEQPQPQPQPQQRETRGLFGRKRRG